MSQSIVKSFINAANGVYYGLLGQRNIKIQLIIGILAIVFSILLKITKIEFIIIITISFLVIILEILNTGIEKLIDFIYPYYNLEIGKIKDIFAGIVLLGAILSTIIGFLIFYEPLLIFFKFPTSLLGIIGYLLILNLILFIIVFFKFKEIKQKKLKFIHQHL